MKRGDLIIACLILVIAVGGLGFYYLRPWQSEGAKIVVEIDGTEFKTYPLNQSGRDELIEVTGTIGITTIKLDSDRVRVVHSDCPDKICVHTGWINRPGVPIACLPNRVLVYVRGEGTDLDLNTR